MILERVQLMWLVALPLVLILLPALSFGRQGKVVGVSDEDTITVLHDGKGEKIRVYGIDCPEKGQDFGQKAKRFTSDKVFAKTVEIEPVTTDRHGRTVALVFFGGGQNLSEEHVDDGYAWVFRKYCTKPRYSLCLELEDRARKKVHPANEYLPQIGGGPTILDLPLRGQISGSSGR